MKFKLIAISILITLFYCPLASIAQNKVSKVVLDAGHGGKDPGAIGAISNEKTITLAVVLRLGKILADSLPSVKTVYTRTTDVYPSLKERHEIANQANGDLFISVHVNSTAPRKETIRTGTRTVGKGKKKRKVPTYKTIYHRETSTSGTETYVLGLHRNSQKEKAIGEFGESIMEEPGLLDESDPTTAIIIGQYSQSFLSRSVSLAGKIQHNFAAQGRADLGVKQKGLEVLAGSVMPGVLIEIGFINNPAEERYLNSDAGVNEVAMSIFKAIRAYKAEREKGR